MHTQGGLVPRSVPEVLQTSSMILGGVWLTHVDVWQKPTQYGKAIILQLKINKFQKKWVAVRIKRMFGTSLELCLRIICVIYVTYFNKTQILFLM